MIVVVTSTFWSLAELQITGSGLVAVDALFCRRNTVSLAFLPGYWKLWVVSIPLSESPKATQ